MSRILKPIPSSLGSFYYFNHCTEETSYLKGSKTSEMCLQRPITYFFTVLFAFWHIPTPHSKIYPCSSPSTGGSTKATLYKQALPELSNPLSPLHPLISLIPFSPFPSPPPAAAAPHATPSAPTTLQAGWSPLLFNPSLCLIMALGQNMRICLFFCQWQILIQTMNLL